MGLFGPSNSDLLRALTGIHAELIQERAVAAIRHQQYLNELDKLSARLKKQLDRIELRVLRIEHGLFRPGRLSIVATQEENGMLKFKVQLPKPPAGRNDITRGELTGTIDGVVLDPIPVSKEVMEIVNDDDRSVTADSLKGNDDAAVHLEFRHVDNAGNASEPSLFDGVLTDTIAPPAPGALGIVATEEVPDEE